MNALIDAIEEQSFLVGGAVRDSLLKRSVKDRDWVVIGFDHGDMIHAGFKCVGADFPVYLHPETGEEYALARRETKTGLGHGGFKFETKDVSLKEDLGRRDFTINAMAWNSWVGLHDPYGGKQDLEEGMIRHIGDAFKEDPLRALRACRFAARYGFNIAMETKYAIGSIARSEFDSLSVERIYGEVRKAAEDDRVFEFLDIVVDLGLEYLIRRLFPFSPTLLKKMMGMQMSSSGLNVDQRLFCVYMTTTEWFDKPHFNDVADMVKPEFRLVDSMEHVYWESADSVLKFAKNVKNDPSLPMGYFAFSGVEETAKRLLLAIEAIDVVNADYVFKKNYSMANLTGPALGAAIHQERINYFNKEWKGFSYDV